MSLRSLFLTLTAACLSIAPSQDVSISRRIELTLTEGTSMAAAVSPDRRWIAIDLVGALWVLPIEGGEAKQISPPLLEARQPAWSADSRSIAFQGYDDGAWHIYTITRGGGEVTQLTTGVFDDREPAWSHDGSRIAFSSDRADSTYSIWEVAVTERTVRQLSKRDGWMPSWTLSDREVAFLSRDRGTPADRTSGLWAVDEDGRERMVQPFRANDMPDAFGWSTTGLDLAHVADGRLFLNGRPVPSNEDVFPFRPQWISRAQFVYTADGRIKRRTLDGAVSEIPFTAKVTLQRSTFPIQHRDLEPQEPQRLTGLVAPAVSPDGRAVAFVAMGDLWLLPVGGAPVQVTDDAAVEIDPAWSPDGSQLAFSSDRGGRMDLWIRDLRTNEDRRLTDRGGVSSAAWSPDGNHLAFLINRRELSAITIRRDQHTLTIDNRPGGVTGELGRPTWSADNRSVAVGALFPYSNRFREGVNQVLLYSFEPSARLMSVLFPEHSAGNRERNGPVWSPDGFRMAFVTEGTLWTVTVDERGSATAPPRPIATDQPDSPSWERDSQHIVYQTPAGLRRVSSDGGIPEPIPLSLEWKSPPPLERVVVHAGHLFDGAIEGLGGETDLVIERGIIREISGHRTDLHVGGAVVDASDDTVMPGLIEMHAHLDPDYGANFGRIWLAFGITSLRIPAVNAYAGLEQREAFDAGRRPGPRVFLAGDPFDGVRIYYPGGVSIASDEQLDRELDRAQTLGMDFFKTYVRLPDRLQKRVVEYAHGLGRPVTSHELYPAVAFGVDGVEHLRGTSRRGYSPKLSATNRAYRDVIDSIAKSGITLTPTIGIQGGFVARETGDRTLLFDERLALYPRPVVAQLADMAARQPSPELDRAVQPYEAMLKAIAAAGGRIIAGTDSPIIPYGLGLHAELESYVHAGLTPFQALQTATINAAQALGLDSELGTIEVGKRADLAFIGGDPLQDIRNARNVRRVMRGGRLYTISELLPR